MNLPLHLVFIKTFSSRSKKMQKAFELTVPVLITPNHWELEPTDSIRLALPFQVSLMTDELRPTGSQLWSIFSALLKQHSSTLKIICLSWTILSNSVQNNPFVILMFGCHYLGGLDQAFLKAYFNSSLIYLFNTYGLYIFPSSL